MNPDRGRHSTHSVGSSQQVRHNELGFLTVDDKLLSDLEFGAVRTVTQHTRSADQNGGSARGY